MNDSEKKIDTDRSSVQNSIDSSKKKSNLKLYSKEEKSIHDSLIDAVKNREDVSVIEKLLKRGASVNYKNRNGYYSLYWAKFNSDSIIINLLLEYDAIDYNDTVAIFFKYCENGIIDSVKLMFARGFDVNSRRIWYEYDGEGGGFDCYETALPRASKSGNIDLVEYLINQGAKVNFDEYGVQPLLVALQNRKYKIAELLLKYDANKNAKSILGKSYFDFVDTDTVYLNYLIKNKYPYGKYWGLSPITEAAENNDLVVLRMMCEVVDKIELNKSLSMATSIDVASFLIEKGANVNYEFSFDELESGFHTTPLSNAVGTNNINYVRFLIKKGADINLLDKYSGKEADSFSFRASALLVSVFQRNVEMANYLISEGANLNYLQNGSLKISPLIVAVENNDIEMLNLLLKSNAKLINKGVSIFNFITERTQKEIIKTLNDYR